MYGSDSGDWEIGEQKMIPCVNYEFEFEHCISCHHEFEDGYGKAYEFDHKGVKYIGCCNFEAYLKQRDWNDDGSGEKEPMRSPFRVSKHNSFSQG